MAENTERELLVLAAKAGGVRVDWVYTDQYPPVSLPDGYFVVINASGGHSFWNPLRDDGDALRLAADLRLRIKPGKHKGDGCTVESQRDGIAGCTAFYEDPAQQMRQAVVITAAEIGRAMP